MCQQSEYNDIYLYCSWAPRWQQDTDRNLPSGDVRVFPGTTYSTAAYINTW